MTAQPSDSPHAQRAQERWTRVVEAVGARIVGAGRAEMACPVHGGDKPNAFAISVGDESEYPLLRCRSACNSDDPAWIAQATKALLALGAPADALPPAKGGTSGRRASGAKPAPRKANRAAAVLPTAEQVDAWAEALFANRMMLRVINSKWGVDDEALALADVGWDQEQRRYTLPVYDEAGEVAQVIYRSLQEDLPPGAPKSRTRKGVTGSHVYAPFGIPIGRRVVLCAGERDVFAANAAGYVAVCFTNGERAAPPVERLTPLRGREVVVAYDNDDAGRSGAQRVAAALAPVAKSVAVADLAALPGLATKGDVADVLAYPNGGDLLRGVLLGAVPWEGPGEGVPVSPPASSWLAVDLTAVLAGDYVPQQTNICERADGLALFYKGSKHVLVAESEAGKTWLALFGAVEQMNAEQHVVFIDFEDTEHGMVGRLRALGLVPAAIATYFHYLRPDEPLTDQARNLLLDVLAPLSPALVVLDGVTEAMALHGWEINSNNDVATFYKVVMRPFGDLGAAVVALDHLPKDDVKRRGSIGGVHKLNGIDGAVYRLENVHQIIPGREGMTRVVIDKDRPGWVRKHQDEKKRIAELWVFSDDDGSVRLALELPRAPLPSEEDGGQSNRALNATGKRVLAVLAAAPGELTVSAIETGLTKAGHPTGRSTVQRWLRALEDIGLAKSRAEDAPGRTVFHWIAVPQAVSS